MMRKMMYAAGLLAWSVASAGAHQISDMTELQYCTVFTLAAGGQVSLPNTTNPLNVLDEVTLITDKSYLVAAMWSYKFPPASGQVMQWYWDAPLLHSIAPPVFDANCGGLLSIRNLRSKQ